MTWLGMGLLIGCTAPVLPVPPCAELPARGAELLVAGSGVWSPILGDRSRAGVRISESIGSSGAVLAVLDGVIDVGLLSRPLSAREAKRPLHIFAAGTSELVFWSAALPRPSTAALSALYSGERRAWPDGTPVRLLAREPGDSGWLLICARLPELCATMRDAVLVGRAQVAWTDAEMRMLLAHVPGAVGPIDEHGVPGSDEPVGGPAQAGLSRQLFVITHAAAGPAIKRLAATIAKEAADASR